MVLTLFVVLWLLFLAGLYILKGDLEVLGVIIATMIIVFWMVILTY